MPPRSSGASCGNLRFGRNDSDYKHTHRYCFQHNQMDDNAHIDVSMQKEPIIILSFHYFTSSHCGAASHHDKYSFVPIILVHNRIISLQPLATIPQRTLYTSSNSSQRFKNPSSQPGVVSISHSPSNLHFAPCSSCGVTTKTYIFKSSHRDF